MAKISIFFLVAFLFTACGYDDKKKSEAQVETAAYKSIKGEISEFCHKCHNGEKHPLNLLIEKNFNQEKVKNKIANNAMPPPPAALAVDVKAKFLDYFVVVAKKPSPPKGSPY